MKILSKNLPFSSGALLVCAASVLAIGLSGCAGSGSSGNVKVGSGPIQGIQLSGTIGSGYATAKPLLHSIAFGTPAYALGDPVVDQVVAIPMRRGQLEAYNMGDFRSAPVVSGESFTLDLSTNTDWVLVLLDSSAAITDRFVGSILLNTGTSNGLLNLPATTTTISQLDLGMISRLSSSINDGLSANSVMGQNFNMTADQLSVMVKTGDIFRNAKNLINNYNLNTGKYYQLRPDFSLNGDYSQLAAGFSSPSYTYIGMNFQMDTNYTSVTINDICTQGTVSLALVPSSDIYSDQSTTYNSTQPLTNTGVPQCTTKITSGVSSTEARAGDIYATDSYGGMSYSTLPRFISIPIPPETWLWKENDLIKAKFDLASITPPITAAGKPKGYVPSFKLNLGGATGTQILSVDVKWYYYDETSDTYIELAPSDLSILSHFIERLEVKFDVTYPFPGGTRRTCEMYFDPTTATSVSPSDPTFNCPDTWYYQDPTHPETDTGLMGFYATGGFGYFFNFFKPF